MRTTISEIARQAGVSPATVDRVLNDREGVKPRTRDIVLQVARKLGYFGPPDDTPEIQEVRLDFVLPAGSNSFIRALKRNLVEVCNLRSDVSAAIHEIEGFDPHRLSAKLAELHGRTDAVGLVALDHPQVREAINDLARSGVRIGTLLSDIPTVQKVGYVGVDNRAAGRLAGHLLGRFLPPGPHNIAVFIGSPAYRGHEEREMGLRSILSEEYPELKIVGTAEVSDDRDLAYSDIISIHENRWTRDRGSTPDRSSHRRRRQGCLVRLLRRRYRPRPSLYGHSRRRSCPHRKTAARIHPDADQNVCRARHWPRNFRSSASFGPVQPCSSRPYQPANRIPDVPAQHGVLP